MAHRTMHQAITRRTMVAAALAAPLAAAGERVLAQETTPAASDSDMTYDNEAIVRHAYHTAEGNVLDVAGFADSFTADGVINLGHAGLEPV